MYFCAIWAIWLERLLEGSEGLIKTWSAGAAETETKEIYEAATLAWPAGLMMGSESFIG
jgi:hypothetical protein